MENDAGKPVGEYLRSVRESRGLRLEEASLVTKVGKNYLVAIEEGQFEKLPNAAYIKGFLRLYAGYLSLSGDEVVARYERGLPASQRPQAETPQTHAGMETLEKAKFSGHGRFMIPALLLGLVVVAAFLYSEGDRQPAPPQPAAPAPVAAPVMTPMTAPVQQQLSSARKEPAPPSSLTDPLPAELPTAKQAGIVLRLRFNRDSWLSITIDDAISQRYDLKAGDIIEWKGSRVFVLDLGDGGAVEAEFNDKPLKPLGESGQPAHVELRSNQPRL